LTREEMLALRRGDVVRRHEDAELGLVKAINERGIFVRWEDESSTAGPYRTNSDAAQLSLYSKVIA
jgi:hypothetical protein